MKVDMKNIVCGHVEKVRGMTESGDVGTSLISDQDRRVRHRQETPECRTLKLHRCSIEVMGHGKRIEAKGHILGLALA